MSLLLGLRRGQFAPSVLTRLTASPLDVTAYDTFTAADGTALTAHTADDGGTWAVVAAFPAAAPAIDNGRVHFLSSAGVAYHSWTPARTDYDVSVDVVLVSDDNLSSCGPAARTDVTADTQYSFRYQAAANAWGLFKRVAGVQTQLGSNVAQTLTVGQGYRATLSVRGSWITGLVDGVARITVTDTAITTGRAGLALFNSGSSTTGVHLDNFRVRR